MRILAFESSCDETAVSVVERDKEGHLYIRSSTVASQVDTHRLYGGVVPEIASRAHVEAITSLCREALDGAGCTPRDLDAVAVTSHPGLIGALLVAVNFAKAFAAASSGTSSKSTPAYFLMHSVMVIRSKGFPKSISTSPYRITVVPQTFSAR